MGREVVRCCPLPQHPHSLPAQARPGRSRFQGESRSGTTTSFLTGEKTALIIKDKGSGRTAHGDLGRHVLARASAPQFSASATT